MKKQYQLTYTVAAIVATMFFIFLPYVQSGARTARAATVISTNYEQNNVLDDLESATFGGESLDLSLYNFDESKNVQIVSFVEFCYSFQSDNQQDYGLYVYIYNPRGYDFTKNQSLNKIQFRAGVNDSLHYNKYPLKYLNRSEKAGFEGLFYKFKIVLTETQRKAILAQLNSTERIYEVTGVELYSSGANATEYKISNTYYYSGYAEGYGSSSASRNTLKCRSEGLDLSLSLEVHPVQYRPKGSSGGDPNTQDILYSVYFSIPNTIINEYGGLSAVHATWLNATTAPIWVTGNSEVYETLNTFLWEEGGYTDYYHNYNYPSYALIPDAELEIHDYVWTEGGYCDQISSDYYSYNTGGYLPAYRVNKSHFGDDSRYKEFKYGYFGRNVEYISYLFYAENGNADNYVVPASEVLEHIKRYTDYNFSLEPVNNAPFSNYNSFIKSLEDKSVAGKYNKNLFASVDEEFTDINIKATDKYTLTSETWGQSFWEQMFGGSHVIDAEVFKNIKAIQQIKTSDIKGSVETTCKNLYLEERDYDEFISFYNSATAHGETVYLFRYYQDKYTSIEVTECARKSDSEGDYLNILDTNAYRAQMVVQLDFDIIDVTCRKGNVTTVIGIISSPQDIVPDTTPPLYPNPEPVVISDWWKYALGIAAALVVAYIIIRVISTKKAGSR